MLLHRTAQVSTGWRDMLGAVFTMVMVAIGWAGTVLLHVEHRAGQSTGLGRRSDKLEAVFTMVMVVST